MAEKHAGTWAVTPEDNIPYSVSDPYLYISDKPLLNTFITLAFIFLFWWSRRRRRAGVKLIYWPLLIPVIVWGFNVALAIETSKEVGVPLKRSSALPGSI
ncbi:MAG: hypothetical protein HY796_03005 [Elusimicrobia bacterium]|nr:hypothetical protein [Elusimicrobiota bacterium]